MCERPDRVVRMLLKIAGTVFLVIGGVGIVLPLLPTTPFLLLAAVCYARSSERWYNWLLHNRWFGSYVRNWREGKGIPMRTKILSVVFLTITIGYSAAFVVPFVIGKIVLILIAVCVSVHIFSLPTLEPDSGA